MKSFMPLDPHLWASRGRYRLSLSAFKIPVLHSICKQTKRTKKFFSKTSWFKLTSQRNRHFGIMKSKFKTFEIRKNFIKNKTRVYCCRISLSFFLSNHCLLHLWFFSDLSWWSLNEKGKKGKFIASFIHEKVYSDLI